MSSKICRLCLNNSEVICNIFEHDIKELSLTILKCTGIQIMQNDDFPTGVCVSCVQTVTCFNSFRNKCLQSDKILREKCALNKLNNETADVNKVLIFPKINIYDNSSNSSATNLDCDESVNLEDGPGFQSNEICNVIVLSHIQLPQNKCRIKETKPKKKFRNRISKNLIYTEQDYTILEGERKVRIYEVDDTIRKIIGDNIYVCEICSTQFESFFEYHDHQKIHNGQFVFNCSKCNEVFSNRQNLVDHDARHKIPCKVCELEVLPKSMPAHLLIHTDVHKCPECGMRHTSKASLEKHIKARHTGIKGFVCHVCGKQSSCQSSMNRHMAYHSSERPYKCKHCDFCAKSLNIVQVHTSRKHFAEKCVCEICAKLFKSQPSLIQHMKRIHTARKHICDICGKAFIERYNLNRHLKKHAGQRLHECKICHKEFFTIRKLKEHMHSHRQGCVNCPKCGKEFFYKKYYTKHVLKCTKTQDNFLPMIPCFKQDDKSM